MRHFTSVLLPAPFSPRMAWKVPGLSRSETASSATRSPKRLVMPTTSTSGGRAASGGRAMVTPVTGRHGETSSSADRQLAGRADQQVARGGAPDQQRQRQHV